MRKKQLFLSMGAMALVFGLGIGIATGFFASKGEPTLASNVPGISNFIPGTHTNETIESLKSELERIVEYEMAYGCVEFTENKEPKFCGDSKKRIDNLESQLTDELHKLELGQKSSEQITLLENTIRTLSGQSSSVITFQGTSNNPYTKTQKRIEHWKDQKGFDYWVDSNTNQVVQFGPGPDSIFTFERDGKKSLSQTELKSIAENYLSKNIKNFDELKKQLNFRQMSKPGNATHAFRWEAKTMPTGEEILPFIQIVLSPTGEVISFADIRSLYSQN